ncbi:DNA (cytosine-5)-methyltransferase 3A-like [Diadema antillarum]|uniref:DNA (cytosine-5)-methyltransferase 3A-like n=1 Tax=Diadema antillarum TaxID=105358 RepID=UPI003A87F778
MATPPVLSSRPPVRFCVRSDGVLLRVFPTWDRTKQKHTALRISVKYGPAFLRLLKSTSSKMQSQIGDSLPEVRKRELEDDVVVLRSSKRLKRSSSASSPATPLADSPSAVVEDNGGVREMHFVGASPCKQSTTQSAADIPKGAAGKIPSSKPDGVKGEKASSDDHIPSQDVRGKEHSLSSYGLREDVQRQHVSEISREDKLSTSDEAADMEARKTPNPAIWKKRELRSRHKSLHSMREASGKNYHPCESEDNQEELNVRRFPFKEGTNGLSSAGGSVTSISRNDGTVCVSETSEECEEIKAYQIQVGYVESDESSDNLRIAMNSDPMLSAASSVGKSQDLQGSEDLASHVAGLRFQSLSVCSLEENEKAQDGEKTLLDSSSPVNSSLVEDVSPMSATFDSLLPGLEILQVCRRSQDASRPQDLASRLEVKCDKVKKSPMKKKSKGKKSKQESMMSPSMTAAGKGCHKKPKQTPSPVKSPVFEMGPPVSNWANLNKPVTSPCHVFLKDSLKYPRMGELQELGPLETSSEPQDKGLLTFQDNPSTKTSPSNAGDGTPAECKCPAVTQEKVTNERPGQDTQEQTKGSRLLSPKMFIDQFLDYLEGEPDAMVGKTANSGESKSTRKDSVHSEPKKQPKKESHSDGRRGRGGWEASLRQCPQKITLFQLGQTPGTNGSKSTTKDGLNSPGKKGTPSKKKMVSEPSSLDKDDKDMTAKAKANQKKTSTPVQEKEDAARDESFPRGQLVLGKMKGYCWWPGKVIHHYDRSIPDSPPPLARWVQWYGDNKVSLLSLGQIVDFEKFPEYFSSSSFQKLSLYQKACYQALNVAAERCGKDFRNAKPDDLPAGAGAKEKQEKKTKMLLRFQEMKEWAFGGFPSGGSTSIRPSEEEKRPPLPPPESPAPSSPVGERSGTTPCKNSSRKPTEKEVFLDVREERMKELRDRKWTIEEICIGCGSLLLSTKHPLFDGGLCEVCRIEYLEVAYLYDCEGYQAHCCICAEGKQITLCGNLGCYHSYCTDCMNFLVGPLESRRVSQQDPWSCYLCSSIDCHGYLKRRVDWQERLVEFFNQDQFMEFPPLRVYKPHLPAERRPIRVLSLFDGIGTGMLVLRDLGFDVDCYVASEISDEAIMVAAVRLQGEIKQIGDVQKITTKELASWGPFDLLIGGSPCNDLSVVNPARKGLEGGTGLLFFEFYRILKALEPGPDDPRPFFWLFENVVHMGRKDKQTICRFLECHPVMIDARHVSPSHRARYYWGNLPGMHRPYVAAAGNPLILQECLEPHCDRQAQFSKVATITTRSNSIRQTKDAILPVIMNGKEDGLWATELERLFGFPDHYTDIGNLSRTNRQKLLGKAWCVPVIKHLMAPLKDYFSCRHQE